MKFDLSKVYTSANCDRLEVGDLIYFSDRLDELKAIVEKNDVNEAVELCEIQEGKSYPFGVDLNPGSLNYCFYALAYECEEKKPVGNTKLLCKILDFVQEFRNNWIIWEDKETGNKRYSFMESVFFDSDDNEISISFTDYLCKRPLAEILSKECDLYIGMENYLDFEQQEKQPLRDVLKKWLDMD